MALSGNDFAQPLAVQISSAANEPVGPGSVITFTPPGSGPGLSVAIPFTAISDAAGLVTPMVTANGLAGSYAVSVTTQGAAVPVVFNLTNNPLILTVATDGTGSGAVTSNPAGIDCGATCSVAFNLSTVVTLTATASTGYTFANWTEGGTVVSTNAAYTFMATGNRTLVANFTALPQPLARNDAAGVLEGQTIAIPVLANDLDPAGGGLALIAVTQGANGTTTIEDSGSFVRYTATANFLAEDSFSYTVEDSNGLTSTAMVVIVMSPSAQTNQAPQLEVIDSTVQNSTTFISSVASLQVELPAGFFTGTLGATDVAFLMFTPVITPTANTQTLPATLQFGNLQFQLSLYINNQVQTDVSFAQPITLTIHYDAALLQDLEPATLQLLTWDGAGWVDSGITILSHDSANATMTVALSRLSEFAFFAAPKPDGVQPRLYLPLIGR